MEYFPRIGYVAALRQSQKFTVQIGRNTRKFHRTTFPVEQKIKKKNVWQMLDSFFLYSRRFGKGQSSFIGPGSEEKWYCISEDSPHGIWDYCGKDVVGIRRQWMSSFPLYDSIVQRSTQKQRTWKTVDTLCSLFGND